MPPSMRKPDFHMHSLKGKKLPYFTLKQGNSEVNNNQAVTEVQKLSANGCPIKKLGVVTTMSDRGNTASGQKKSGNEVTN